MGRLLTRFAFLLLFSNTVFFNSSFAEGPSGPSLSGVSIEEAQSFLQARQHLAEQVRHSPTPWEDIAIIYAIVDPHTAKQRVLQRITTQKPANFSHAEFSFWLQAAWEVFKVTGDRDFLKIVQTFADKKMDAWETGMDPKKVFYPVKTNFLQTQLVMAYAWRVLGYTHGVGRFPGRAIYCEQHFQKLRRFIQNHPDFKSHPKADFWARHWDIQPSSDGLRLPWAKLQEGNATIATHWVRDVFGLRLQPFYFDLVPHLECDFDGNPKLQINIQKADVNIHLKSCGEQIKALKVNGEKMTPDGPIVPLAPHPLNVHLTLR